jgi:hypothetical protein
MEIVSWYLFPRQDFVLGEGPANEILSSNCERVWTQIIIPFKFYHHIRVFIRQDGQATREFQLVKQSNHADVTVDFL